MGGQNRIVVDYGDYEGLVLLGTFDNNGKEYDIDIWRQYGFDVVKKYDGIQDYKTLKSSISKEREGYVIKFRSGLRVKIKSEYYVHLHKLLTEFSNAHIWEYLKDKKDITTLLDSVPDEFDSWVKNTVRELNYACYQIRERAGKLHDGFRYGKYGDVDPEPSKKEFAKFVMEQQEVLHAVMFAMWDKNNEKVDDLIWKIVKPEYARPIWSKTNLENKIE